MPDDQVTLQQFGATIKKKYPAYASRSDEEVGKAMLAKYPQYKERIRVAAPPEMVPQTETQFEKDRSFTNRALGATQPLNTGSAAAGQTVKRAAEGIANTAQHPLEALKGMALGAGEMWGAAFGAPIDANSGPLGQRIEQFKQEYAKDPAEAVKNAAGDILGLYLQGKIIEGVTEHAGPATRVLMEKSKALRDRAVETVTGTGPKVTKELVKQTTDENVVGAKHAQEHLEKTRDAIHETEGRQIAHRAEVKTIEEENARRAQSARDEAAEKNRLAAQEHMHQTQAALHETHGRELTHEQAVKATDEENARIQQEHAKKVQTVEEANAAKVKEHEAAKAHAEKLAKDAKETETQRGKLARQVKEQSARMVERVRRVKEATKAKLDTAYQEIREALGNKRDADGNEIPGTALSVPREWLANSVTKAEGMLKGSSENIKIFRDILAKAPEDEPAFVKTNQGSFPKGHPLYSVLNAIDKEGKIASGEMAGPAEFGDLQGYYSELGDKLSGGNLPSDVYLALKSLREDVGGMMDNLAHKGGVRAKFRATQAMYRDYMQTFRESAGPNHSGSPLAQVLDAADPDYAVKPLTEASTASRIRNMLARFDPDRNGVGGAAQLYDNFRNVTRQYEGLGDPIEVPEAPKPPKLDATPSAPEPKQPPVAPSRVAVPDRPPEVAPKPFEPQSPPAPPERAPHPDRPSEAESGRKTIGTEDVRQAKDASMQGRADWIRKRAGMIATTFGVYRLLSSVVHGDLASLPNDFAGAAVGFSGTQLIAKVLENPAIRKALTEPTARDLAEITPELRGDLKPIIEQAQKQGIKVDPRVLQLAGIAVGPKAQQLRETSDQYRTTPSQ